MNRDCAENQYTLDALKRSQRETATRIAKLRRELVELERELELLTRVIDGGICEEER